MVTGNTETGITVTYQDSDGTLDFVVASQTDENFTTTLKNKLDGIAAGATNVTNNNQLTNGAGYITSASDSTKLPLSGGELTGDLTTHVVKPDGNNTRTLGTSSLRWSDVFTNDLHLSNKGGSNKVDNTWGDFTIQEGEEDLFLSTIEMVKCLNSYFRRLSNGFQRHSCSVSFCHFKGTGTVSINDSFNVSSITDSGTGRYFVNYSTATAGINYSVNVGGYFDTSDSAGSTRPFQEEPL